MGGIYWQYHIKWKLHDCMTTWEVGGNLENPVFSGIDSLGHSLYGIPQIL